MLVTFSLSNGIKVATYALPSVKSIHLRLSTKCGSLVELKSQSGTAHFMEHILVQGIPSLPDVEQFSSYIEGLAGSYGAHTQSLFIGFDITLPAIHLEDALRISSEVFFQPLFKPDAIERERQVVIEEIQQKMDSHWYQIGEFYRQQRYRKNHPLIRTTTGDIAVIQRLTRDDLVKFYKRYFLPSNTYILVIGNFDRAAIKQLIGTYFGSYTSKKQFAGFPSMSSADFSTRKVAVRQDMKLKTCYVDLSYPSIGLESPIQTRLIQNLAFVILGELRNSRLFRLLRYEHGLVYDVQAGFSAYPNIGDGYISSEVSEENLQKVSQLIVEALAKYLQQGPTQAELDFARYYLTNQWLMAFDHPASIAGWVGNNLLWEDTIRLPEAYADLIATITVNDLAQFMKKHWDFSKVNFIVQGPIHKPDQLRQYLSGLVKQLV